VEGGRRRKEGRKEDRREEGRKGGERGKKERKKMAVPSLRDYSSSKLAC
jgi:hypothetical protein